jgi:hypothetical protein
MINTLWLVMPLLIALPLVLLTVLFSVVASRVKFSPGSVAPQKASVRPGESPTQAV